MLSGWNETATAAAPTLHSLHQLLPAVVNQKRRLFARLGNFRELAPLQLQPILQLAIWKQKPTKHIFI